MVVCDYESGNVDMRRLELEGERVEEVRRGWDIVCVLGSGDVGGFGIGPRGDTVISDQGVGQDEDLTRVRRVGQ